MQELNMMEVEEVSGGRINTDMLAQAGLLIIVGGVAVATGGAALVAVGSISMAFGGAWGSLAF